MKLTENDLENFFFESSFRTSTKSYYHDLLFAFLRWIGDRDFNIRTVKEYADSHYSESKPQSKNTFLAVIKSFTNWKSNHQPTLAGASREEVNRIFMDMQELGRIKGIRKWREIKELKDKNIPFNKLKEIYTQYLDPKGVQFAALWCLGWFGCRAGELVSLKPDRIDYLKGEAIFDTEKTNLQRRLYFDEFTGKNLERYMKSGPRYQFLYRSCVRIGKKMGRRLTPHSFRHTFHTEMLNALPGAGFRSPKLDIVVKKMMGRSETESVMRYTGVGDDIRKAMIQHHYLISIERSIAAQMMGESSKGSR